YLLKDRVADVEDFLDAVDEVAGGGTVLDPEVVSQILVRTRKKDGLSTLSPRELEVLQLMAEGKSNAAIARILYLSAGAVEKLFSSVSTMSGLTADTSDTRRVLAVLTFLGAWYACHCSHQRNRSPRSALGPDHPRCRRPPRAHHRHHR